jgi:hypothetical protein
MPVAPAVGEANLEPIRNAEQGILLEATPSGSLVPRFARQGRRGTDGKTLLFIRYCAASHAAHSGA